MSGIGIVLAKLVTLPAVVSAVGGIGKLYPIEADQGVPPPYIVVNHMNVADTQMLAGAGEYYESRIRVMIVGATRDAVENLGTTIVTEFGRVVKQSFAGATDIDFRKADMDMSDSADDRSTFRRIVDYYVNWRLVDE